MCHRGEVVGTTTRRSTHVFLTAYKFHSSGRDKVLRGRCDNNTAVTGGASRIGRWSHTGRRRCGMSRSTTRRRSSVRLLFLSTPGSAVQSGSGARRVDCGCQRMCHRVCGRSSGTAARLQCACLLCQPPASHIYRWADRLWKQRPQSRRTARSTLCGEAVSDGNVRRKEQEEWRGKSQLGCVCFDDRVAFRHCTSQGLRAMDEKCFHVTRLLACL